MGSHRKNDESWSITVDRQRYGQVITVQLLRYNFFKRRKLLGTGGVSVSRDQRPVSFSILFMTLCT